MPKLSERALRSAAASMYDWVPIFSQSDGSAQFRGLRTAVPASALLPGEAGIAANNRYPVGGPIKPRLGISSVIVDTSGLPAAYEFRGMSSPMLFSSSSKHFLVAAVYDTGVTKVRLYRRGYTASTDTWDASWSEMTASSGQFGDTRMSDPDDGLCQFQWIWLHNNTTPQIPACVVFNGKDQPRVCSITTSPFPAVPLNQIDPPEAAQQFPVAAVMNDWLNISDGTVTVSGSATADWGTVQRAGSAGAYYWEFNTAAAVSGASSASIVSSSDTLDVVESIGSLGNTTVKQLILIVQYDDRKIWDNLKVEAGVGATPTWFTVHDPNNDLHGFVEVGTNVAGYKILAFSMPEVSATASTVIGVRLTTYAAGKHPLSSAIKIHGMAASGYVPGAARYCVCYQASHSGQESGGVLLQMSAQGDEGLDQRAKSSAIVNETSEANYNARTQGVSLKGATVTDDFVFPLDTRLFYNYVVPMVNPTQDNLESNFAAVYKVYRKDPGDRDYYLVSRESLATYSGGWSLDSGTYGGRRSFSDKLPGKLRGFSDRAPSAFNRPPIAANVVTMANNRMYVAGTDNEGTGLKVMASDQGIALRFSSVQQSDDSGNLDPVGAFTIQLDGDRAKGLYAFDGGAGVSSKSRVFLFTDRAYYSVDRWPGSGAALYYLNRLGSYGSVAVNCVTDALGGLFWLDEDRALRSGDRNLSRGRFSDKFGAIPAAMLDRVQIARLDDLLYISLAESGGTRNTIVLVYDPAREMLLSVDTLPANKEPQQWLPWRVGGSLKLYYCDKTGAVREYEKAGQYTDDGTAIAWALESRLYTSSAEPGWGEVVCRHMGLVGTDATGTTVTTTRTFSSPASTALGTIDVDVSTAYAWKQDTKQSPSSIESPGGAGQGVKLKWSASVSVAFEVYELLAELRNAELGGHGS